MHKIIKIKKDTLIGIVGDIETNYKDFLYFVKQYKPNDKRILVSIGNIKQLSTKFIDLFKDLKERNLFYCTYGSVELKKYLELQSDGKSDSNLDWMMQQPSTITFRYPNGKAVVALSSGILPSATHDTLGTSEVAYIRNVGPSGRPSKDGVVWHELYDGRFGYICSGNIKCDNVEYYKYSCNVATKQKLSCQIFNQKGLEDLMDLA